MSGPQRQNVHHDRPLSDFAVQAFEDGAGAQGFIGGLVFPSIDVAKESDRYYQIDKAAWLRVPNAIRGRRQAPQEVEWTVSSDSYACKNYALRDSNAFEDLSNADDALELRMGSVDIVVSQLLRGREQRIANIVTSISNVGSGVNLTGTDQWSDFANSSPLANITTGHAFIRQSTGLKANTAIIDSDTLAIVRRHPELLDLYTPTKGGLVALTDVADAFGVQRILEASAVYNQGHLGQTASMANIWGNVVALAHIVPGKSRKTRTFGASFIWKPEGIATAFQAVRYNDPDPGAKAEFVEAGYYSDEKVIASELCYTITNPI